MKNSLVKRLVLIAFGLVLGLAVAEAVVRGTGLAPQVMVLELAGVNDDPRESTYLLHENPLVGYVPKPSSGETNALGYRGPLYTDPARQGGKRVIFMGDSQTYGVTNGWQDVFTTKLEREFQAGGEKVWIYNLGVPGYSIVQEFEYLKEFGLRLKPDLVVFSMNHNDIQRLSVEMSRLDRMAESIGNNLLPFEAEPASKFARGLQKFALNSALYRYATLTERPHITGAGRLLSHHPQNVSPEVLGSIMAELESLSRQHGFKVSFIMLIGGHKEAWDPVRERFVSANRFPLWDMHADFYTPGRQPSSVKDWMYDDWHFNQNGHGEAAKMMYANRARWFQ